MADFRVRDMRHRDFFWCDNVVIDKYARKLGPYGLAVYMALLRHADQRTQTCFPSHKTLADELGMSKDSVMRAIEALKKVKLIGVRHRKSSAGDAASNLYFIREVVAHSDHLDADSDYGSQPQRLGVAAHSDTNNTQFNKTQKQNSVKAQDGWLSQRGEDAQDQDGRRLNEHCTHGEVCGIVHQPGCCGVDPWDTP